MLAKRERTPGRPGDPCIMVIFGAAGDLTQRKLIPALYNLAKANLLSREFAIVGVAHTAMSTDDFRKKMSDDIHTYAGAEVDPDIWEWFNRRLYYITADFNDKKPLPATENHAGEARQRPLHPRQYLFLHGDRTESSSAPSSSNSPPSA